MAIEFSCIKCQTTLRVQDEHRGKKARCPGCSEIQSVPGGSSEDSPEHLSSSEKTESELQDAGSSPVSMPSPSQATTVGERLTAPYPHKLNSWSMKTPDGQVYGPVNDHEVNQWVSEGRVSVRCELRQSADQPWQNAAIFFPQIDELGGLAPQSSSGGVPAPVSPYANPAGYSNYRQMGPTTHGNYRAHNGVLILVFGIIGIVFLGICPFLPVFSIVAWIMGHRELNAIKLGEVDPEGKGLAMAGYIMGVIGTLIVVLIGVFYIGFFVLMFSFGAMA